MESLAPEHPETVIVTGASAGVGRAIALRFGQAGARVGLIARDEEALNEVKREIERTGGKAAVAPVDVADHDALFSAAERLEAELGPVDVWVNDAMVTVFSPVSEIKPEEFKRVTEVSYLGFVYGSMAAMRLMRPRNRGTIVQVGSALAYRGIPLQAAYCGAKFGIRGFTNSLRTELMHDKSDIHVTIVHLPAVNTPQFDWARTHLDHQPRPVAPVFEPEAAADAVFKAAHERKREYWLGRSTVEIVLGNFLAPALLDIYLARTAYKGQTTGRKVSEERRDNLMRPVHNLHRTRGSFGREAEGTAYSVPGPATRVAVAAAGVLAAGLIGAYVGRAASR
ncbi:MAG TPA: SDR family oxidoreductase [Pseudolabrys sp.]|nr:SDR family oxidoreductase [Pseudolabrys sp.]